MNEQAALYGIKHSNRNFADAYYWGKNQFNSAFPAALACYMRDCGHSAVYIRHVADRKTEVSEIPFSEIFGSPLRNDELYFSFEDVHEPFEHFVHDSLKPIDLILKNASPCPSDNVNIDHCDYALAMCLLSLNPFSPDTWFISNDAPLPIYFPAKDEAGFFCTVIPWWIHN